MADASMKSTATETIGEDFPEDLEEGILELKRERNAVLLAHYYQGSEVQDLADFVGDSLALAQAAKKVERDVIVFCGVQFMAETAKILNPERTVVIPDRDAGCSLADECQAGDFHKFIDEHGRPPVLSYINTSAEVKALSDLICTSSNAVQMARMFGEGPIIFAPDRHLARWVAQHEDVPELIIWPGTECDDAVLAQSDFIASTTGIIQRAVESPASTLIIATEDGVFHQIHQRAPNKELIQAPGMDESCACNQCPYMRLNTLEKVYLCLRDLGPEVVIPEPVRVAALRPIEKMLSLS